MGKPPDALFGGRRGSIRVLLLVSGVAIAAAGVVWVQVKAEQEEAEQRRLDAEQRAYCEGACPRGSVTVRGILGETTGPRIDAMIERKRADLTAHGCTCEVRAGEGGF